MVSVMASSILFEEVKLLAPWLNPYRMNPYYISLFIFYTFYISLVYTSENRAKLVRLKEQKKYFAY